MSSMALLYFLTYFIFPFFLVAGQTPKYVLKGEGDHLKPSIPGQPSSILWKHNGNKIVEFDGSEEQVYDPYKHRITLNWITAELEITDLRYEDSGDYELEVDIHNKVYTSESKLEVIDKVAMPTISCELNEGSSTDGSEVKATLLCSAEPRKPESLMKFEWSSQGKLHPGKILPISLGETQIDEEYVCIVRNPLSSEKATFRAKDCYHEKNSSIALGVGLFFLFLLLGAVVGTVLFLKWKQKACFAKGDPDDVEKQSLAKGSGQKAEQPEDRCALLNREETLASHQPLRRLQRNHETNPDESTGGQKDSRAMIPKGHVKEMAKKIDEQEAKNKQTTPEKTQGLKNYAREQEPASPPLSPGIKDQGLHENADKDDNEGNEPEHSDQSNIEEENGPEQTVTSVDKPEDKHSDVESPAERQESTEEAGPSPQHNQSLHTSNSGKDQDDKESTEEEVHPSEPSDSETENELNQTGEKEPEKPAFKPNLVSEQPGLKNNVGEQEPTSPPLSPCDKDQGSHEIKIVKDEENEPEHSDHSNTEEENGPKETDTPKKQPEDKHSDVESTAEGQAGEDQQPPGDSGGVVSKGHVVDMAKDYDDLAANIRQPSLDKKQGLKNYAGEQEPASPPVSPGIKDQGLHEITDKDDNEGNEPEHSDQSNIEEKNGPRETVTSEEKSEDKNFDVESTAERQDSESTKEEADPSPEQNQSPYSSNSGKAQEENKESTEEEVHPSEPSNFETENQLNQTGEKEPEKTAPDPKPTPEQPGLKGDVGEEGPASSPLSPCVKDQSPHGNAGKDDDKGNETNNDQLSDQPNTKKENGPTQSDTSEEKSEDKHPNVGSTAEQKDSEDTKGKQTEADPSLPQNQSSHTSNSEDDYKDQAKEKTEEKVHPPEPSGSEQETPQNTTGGTAADPKLTPEQPGAEHPTAQGDGKGSPLLKESTPPSAPLPDSPEQDSTSPKTGAPSSGERKDALTEPENDQSEDEEAPSVPAKKNEPHDIQPGPPLTEGLEPKDSDGEQQTESTAETAVTTTNKSNQGDQENKNESDESVRENSSKGPDSENSDQQQEQRSNEPENDSNIKETNSQKSVAPDTPAQPEDVSDGGETEKKLDSVTFQQPENTTPTDDPSATGEHQSTTASENLEGKKSSSEVQQGSEGSEVQSDSSPTEEDEEEDKGKRYK